MGSGDTLGLKMGIYWKMRLLGVWRIEKNCQNQNWQDFNANMVLTIIYWINRIIR